jgi:hypothetical protein
MVTRDILFFLAGLSVGAASFVLWKVMQLMADIKAAQRSTEGALHALHGSAKDEEAQKLVEECKSRLRWQRSVNPEWIEPLVIELPIMVQAIAKAYYPADDRPLLAPGLSQFTRAVHLAALDCANFLQNGTIGRLVDVSANTAIATVKKGREFLDNEKFKTASKWYKRLLPVWQVARWKSPVMWASLAASNVAVRTLQPAVIDIIARRAIELYSGRLAAGAAAGEWLALPEASEPAELPKA